MSFGDDSTARTRDEREQMNHPRRCPVGSGVTHETRVLIEAPGFFVCGFVVCSCANRLTGRAHNRR